MNSRNWQIEQSCPQCGAPVTLEETDRILECPFCRTRLYLAPEGRFSYYLPPAPLSAGELLYIPYWRLRGAAFTTTRSGVTSRFVDANAVAVNLAGLPRSIGLRAQTQKLHFVSADTGGKFIAGDRTPEGALPQSAHVGPGIFIHNFIGETTSRIYSPLILRDGRLCDGILGKPCLAQGPALVEDLLSRSAPPEGGIKFIPTICPYCGWDLEGEKETAVMLCRNCNSAWTLDGHTFRAVPAVVFASPQTDENAVYLPFWRMKVGFDKLELSSRADLIRMANLPRAITAGLEEAPLYFWSPAFKINPNLYVRLCRQMTVFYPGGEEKEELPRTGIYPASLPLEEGVEGITVNLAGMIVDKRKLYPLLAGMTVSVLECRLEYHPFFSNGRELVHPQMGIAIDRTALSFGAVL
jgi:DNA-directed RNA polymerase subunit RPC12/RpoP